MGNNNSAHVTTAQAPPLWTQSLPRDAHRHKKQNAIQGPKVLPERIPGQRLKPTENGRNLQIQGTISPRKASEIAYPSPGYPPPPSLNHHHSSMTALNHPSTLSPSSFYPPSNDPTQNNRFGPTPSKSFTSEPDLRGASPTSHVSLPTSTNIPHTLISESPTKGKIKSKKRYKAPPPPSPLQASISFPLERSEYVPSPCMSYGNQSSVSSPTSKSSKSKPKKMGLFRKRNESRMSNYEMESSYKENRVEGRGKSKERSTTPVPIQISSKKELKEKARSLDNLQHEIRRSPQGLTNSLHSLEIIGNDEPDGHWERMPYENHQRYNISDNPKHIEKLPRINGGTDIPVSSTLERQSKNHRRLSSVERKLYERQLVERRSGEILSSPVGDPKRFDNLDGKTSEQRISYSSCSSYVDNYQKDEWDLAEEEWLNRKKKSENLQKEIVHVVKNLRKTSVSPEPPTIRPLLEKKDISVTPITHRTAVENHFIPEDTPKTFFFGMNPVDGTNETDIVMPPKTALAKLNDQEEVKIVGSSVEYSRHSLKPKEKRKGIERDNWNRSLDYRDKTRSRSRDNGVEDAPKSNGNKRISREIDEFAATIERQKIKHRPSDDLSNSISRKGDGGYHSRQNSGSFHLENEGSDDDNVIRMNLKPTLPRRQLELPRFSPNAAWRSLSVETSSRQKEVNSDVALSDDVFSINEDQIHRYTRPTAPPRTSGEKSADSGISGDAGSPGPMQEFEPLANDKVKTIAGPLAASSPVPSARLEIKRAWTPAQDLDDNSFEENHEHNAKGSLQPEISTTMPKLTSRTNMFSKFSEEERYKRYGDTDEIPPPIKYRNVDGPTDAKSLQRVKRASSSYKTNDIENGIHDVNNEDHWRENWSMSRSIPNSLNACDEPDGAENSHLPSRSKSESRVSLNQHPETKAYNSPSKVVTPGYLQRGNSGHIMYLPEYKAYQLNNENPDGGNVKHSFSGSKGSSTPDQERKSPSGDENPGDPESHHWESERLRDHESDPYVTSKGKRFIVLNGKKNKKFSYQSTVRMMEKKKLEDKLSIEVEEKERRRLQEVEAMMKVEQEFQLKREREKKRLKKQLLIFQQEETNQGQLSDFKKASPDDFIIPESPPKEATVISGLDNQERLGKYDDGSRDHVPPLPSSPPPFNGHRQMSSYQSLPMELNSGYPSTVIPPSNQSGLLSGFKKWVKGKKDHRSDSRSGYMSDASSVTVNSGSPRQEPDGAPAPSTGRKNLDNIRAEIIAASRHRNGTTILEREMGSSRYGSGSPAPSVVSKESLLRTVTPDSKRTISPDSRRSASSEACRLTQELPEMRQELRQYREYRRSSRKALMPYMGISPLGGYLRPSHKAAQVTHNYRRDFCLGSAAQPRLYHPHDDLDLYSRHSNESRKSSKHSKRSSSTEHDGGGGVHMSSSLRRQYSSSKGGKHSVPIPIPPHHDPRAVNHPGIRIVGAHMHKYPPPLISPFNPTKGYRPVNFSPTQGKILSVT